MFIWAVPPPIPVGHGGGSDEQGDSSMPMWKVTNRTADKQDESFEMDTSAEIRVQREGDGDSVSSSSNRGFPVTNKA